MNIKKEVNDRFKNYIKDWNSRFYFIMGGYGSSKSFNTALKLILKCIMEPNRKILITRAVYRTLKESCYDLIKEIIYDMNLEHLFTFKASPLEINCYNGSKMIFLGLDDPMKLKSINGISIIWCEEVSEISPEAFKELNGRLRHMTQSCHIIMTTNPVSKSNWTYVRFFENSNVDDRRLYIEKEFVCDNIFYHHSTVDDNKFVPRDYINELDGIARYDLDLHRVARLGEFGTLGTRVLPQVELMEHQTMLDCIDKIDRRSKINRIGMDFGFIDSYNALISITVDHNNRILYVHREYYQRGDTDDITAEKIKDYKSYHIIADCAEPKAITYYRQQGFNMTACSKFPGSRLANTKKVKRFEKIYISDECPNTYRELKDLSFDKDKNGVIIEDEFNIDPHSFSAIWYALDGYEVSDLKGNAMRLLSKKSFGL